LKIAVKHIVFIIAILTFSCEKVEKESKLETYESNGIKLNQTFNQHLNKRKDEFRKKFKNDTLKYLTYSVDSMLDKLDNNPEYNNINVTKYWILYNYQEMIPELIDRINDDKYVGLTSYADLIIPERMKNGDMNFQGHGTVTWHDLFKVSGRANYLLIQVTGQNFGIVTMNTTKKELLEIQEQWRNWHLELINYW